MIIGLTGYFASGKNTAAEIFEGKGYFVIDVDKIGHSVLNLPKIKHKLIKKFGTDIIENNKINRKKLGTLVFADKKKLQFLNNLVHKTMKIQVKNILKANKKKNVLINAALLYEMNLDKRTDKIIFITADEDIIIKRGKKRNGFSEEKIHKILEYQKKK